MSPDVPASYLPVLLAGLILATPFSAAFANPASPSESTSPAPKPRILESYGNFPLSFEANTGQADKGVRFLSRGRGYGLYLTGDEAVLTLRNPASDAGQQQSHRKLRPVQKSSADNAVRMQFVEASGRTDPIGDKQLPGTVNYFIGSDPARWRTSIPAFAKVLYPCIYPGIDLVYYGNQGQLEFDFVVAPHADPRSIRLRFSGVTDFHLAANRDLVITAGSGSLAFHKPSVYQIVDGRRHTVAGDFALLGKHTVGFRLGSYDRAKALVIDPVLAFSTFLGGSGGSFFDQASAVAVDGSGNVYVAGTTSSTNFPVTPGAYQTTNHSAANQSATAFVTKLNPTGTALVYSTYLGGSGGDGGDAIAVNAEGNAYVTGQTFSTDFPVTPGAFQTTNKAAAGANSNAFVTKLNPTGTALVYSTYLGGSGLAESSYGGDTGNAIAVDAAGDAYVAGQTLSVDFPVTQGAFQTTNKATANDCANAFITKLSPGGTALVYSTYLGGSGGNAGVLTGDKGHAIAVDAAGNVYVAGQTTSTDFPVTPGAYQTTYRSNGLAGSNAFVTELDPTGAALVYSTYLGGSSSDNANAIAVDASGEAYVAGQATSTDFPVTPGAFQTTNKSANAFITKLNVSGTALLYSTYLGGSGGVVNITPSLLHGAGDQASGLAIDNLGNAYITGSTASADFPVTQDAYQATNNDQPPCAERCIGGYNAFITELNSTGSALVYSTYLGGNGINPYDFVGVIEFGQGDQANSLALDSSDNVYVAGSACSSDFPLTGGAFQTTISSRPTPFVAKLNMSETSSATTPTVTVAPASSTITSGRPLSVTISVSGASGGAVPTGTVTLASGTYSSSPATLTNGSATINIPGGSLVADPGPACGYPPSPDILSVNYLPDAASSATYKFSSALASVEVLAPCVSTTPDLTTITLTQSQSQPFLLAIAATGGTGNPVPTGTVTITTGSYSSAPATLSGGAANISIPPNTFTQLGNNVVNVSYSGDSNYAPYPHAGAAIIIVSNASGIGYTITGTAVTIKAGATAGNTSTITVTSAGGFEGEVTLTAAVTSSPSGAQNPPTLSLVAAPPGQNQTVLIGPDLTGTATLTISTTAASGSSQAYQGRRAAPWDAFSWYTGGGAGLACIVLFGIRPRRRNWRVLFGMLALLILACGFLACGGNGCGKTCQGGMAGTTPGTYTITVTGTSGPTTATGTVTLTVQ